MESDPGNSSGQHVQEETSDVWSELFRTVASLNDAVDLSLQASGADASTEKVSWRAFGPALVGHCTAVNSYSPRTFGPSSLSFHPSGGVCYHEEAAGTEVGADHAAEQGRTPGTVTAAQPWLTMLR